MSLDVAAVTQQLQLPAQISNVAGKVPVYATETFVSRFQSVLAQLGIVAEPVDEIKDSTYLLLSVRGAFVELKYIENGREVVAKRLPKTVVSQLLSILVSVAVSRQRFYRLVKKSGGGGSNG